MRFNKSFSVCLEFAIALTTFGAYFWMLLFSRTEAFAEAGLSSLRFYTVLSNLYAGAVSFVCGLFRLRDKSARSSGALALLKLSATSCVAVTFTVVMVFLGPLFGYGLMFRGANLFFHLLVPMAAALSYLFSDPLGEVSFRFGLLALIPTALYGTVYMINVLVNGVEGNDFYSFAYWGIGIGCGIFALILGLNLLLLFLLRLGAKRISEKR